MTKFEGIQDAFKKTLKGIYICKNISKNTQVYNNGDVLSLVLHDTKVFSYNVKTGDIVIKTGGWMTTTTRNTINTAFVACNLKYKISFAKGRIWINSEDITKKYKYSYCFAA